MTDHESHEISQLRQLIVGYRREVLVVLEIINGEGQNVGLKGRVDRLEQAEVKSSRLRDNKWMYFMLGVLPSVAPIIYAIIYHGK